MPLRVSPLLTWSLLYLVLLAVPGGLSSRQLSKLRDCKADQLYSNRRFYVYKYEATVEAGFVGISEIRSGSKLTCTVKLSVLKKCEASVELSSCELMELGDDGKLQLSPRSRLVAKDLEKHEVYVQINNGVVVYHQFVVNKGEPLYVVNIKRGIVSQLQRPIPPANGKDNVVMQQDIFGTCPTRFLSYEKDLITTSRDIPTCSLPQLFGRHVFSPSVVKTFQVRALETAIDELIYPFSSQVNCTYRLSVNRGIERSECVQQEKFQPFSMDRQSETYPTTTIKQLLTLDLLGTVPRSKRGMKGGLQGRDIVGLGMEFEEEAEPETGVEQVFSQLGQLTSTYAALSEVLPPIKFRVLVNMLRTSSEKVLEEVLDSLLLCRTSTLLCRLKLSAGDLSPALMQEISETFFADGLLSCGTDACVGVYVIGLQRGLVGDVAGEFTLFNMALFYEPSPAVLRKIFDLCKAKSSRTCWLSLGNLVSKLSNSVRSSSNRTYVKDGKANIKEILHHLLVAMGDTCRLTTVDPITEHHTLSSVMLTVKTLGNAGAAIQDFHDDESKEGKGLVPILIQCLKNSALPEKLSRAVILAMGNLELSKELQRALRDLLSDTTRPSSLRTAAFDFLLRLEDEANVRALLQAVQGETMGGVKSYMVTRLGHLLETNTPDTARLRTVWKKVMTPANGLPELEQLRGRASHHGEFSFHTEVPLVKLPIGAKFVINLIYEPSRIIFSAVKVSLGLTVNNVTLELIEVALDVQGFENIAREVLGPDFDWKKIELGTLIAKIMQAVLPKNRKTPTFSFQDQSVVKALQELIKRVNMPSGEYPQAQLHVRLLGKDVGFVHLEDFIALVRDVTSPGSEKRPPAVLTLINSFAKGINLFMGKSQKMVELKKMIPTVAGLPLHLDVQGTMVASAMLNATNDVSRFRKEEGPLQSRGRLKVSVAVAKSSQGTIKIGNAIVSRLKLNMSTLFNGELGGRLHFSFGGERRGALRQATPRQATPRQATPRQQILELGLEAPKNTLNVLSIRSDLFVIRNGKELQLQTPSTQREVQLCVPQFMQKWTGQRLCLSGFYQEISPSASLPIFSGPVNLAARVIPADRNLTEYKAAFMMTRDGAGPQTRKQVFRAAFSAPGEQLKRQLNINVTVDPQTMDTHVDAAVPELSLLYNFDLLSPPTDVNATSHLKVSSVLSLQSRILHSFILEKQNNEEEKMIVHPHTGTVYNFSSFDMMAKFNMSVPGISFHAEFESSRKKLGLLLHKFTIRYYCEPSLGIFYSLHWRPRLASRSGDVSEYVFKNEANISGTSLDVNWKALDTMSITVPGDNVTLVNSMSANLSAAERNTTIYWKSRVDDENETQDVIRMHAKVHNNSSDNIYRYHYTMHLDYEGRFDLYLDGRLDGPLSDIAVHTNIDFKSKTVPQRQKRSPNASNRLSKMEPPAVSTSETSEDVASRQWVQLTNAFLDWLSGGAQQESHGSQQTLNVTSAEKWKQQSSQPKALSSALSIFMRPSWRIEVDERTMIHPRLSRESQEEIRRNVGGFDITFYLNIVMTDPRVNILSFNGTVGRGLGWDLDMDWMMSTELANFTLMYIMQQRRGWPLFYHFHQWRLVDTSAHSFDRSFSLLFDLERNDHFRYNLTLVSPHTNVSHAINFSTDSPQLRTVRASMYLHCVQPQFDIRYNESSTLTPKGLVTTVDMNSTWIDLNFDMNIDFLAPDALRCRKRFNINGKVPFLLGPRQIDVELSKGNRSLSFLLAYEDSESNTTNILLQLQSKDTVVITFSNRMAGAKNNVTSYEWRIQLAEPTVLQNTIEWNPKRSQEKLGAVRHIIFASAHSLKVFGETMASNLPKNVTDMVVPFINQTVSEVIDRVAKARMKQVAAQGLDPRQHTPVMVMIMKGGLKIVQELQTAWQNSDPGQLAESLGVYRMLSYAVLATTGFPSFMLKRQPFFFRQLMNFRIRPALEEMASKGRFNFSVVLPFLWESFESKPRHRLLIRQTQWWDQQLAIGSKADLPLLAILPAHRVQTFDGLTLDVEVPVQEQTCTYLLCTNLDTGSYSVLLSNEGVSVVTQTTGLTLTPEGKVTSIDRQKEFSQMPVAQGDLQVMLEAGQVIVGLPRQVRVTLDPFSQVYIIETSFDVHNRSLGLLGTPTGDRGDDLMTPAGRLAPDSVTFQSSYEMTGQQHCRNVKPASSHSVCPNLVAFCEEVFLSQDSALSQCFAFVDPLQFYELCIRQACERSRMVNSTCPVIQSYLKLCLRSTQIDVSSQVIKKACDPCEDRTASTDGKLDIILGVALSDSGLNTVDLQEVFDRLAGQLVEAADTRFGFIHGAGEEPRALLFDGSLFASAKEAQMIRSRVNRTAKNVSAVEVVLKATDYPFRADARRLLVLVTDAEASPSESLVRAQKEVQSLGISVILVSEDAYLVTHRVLGVTWDNRSVARSGSTTGEISIPKTSLGRLAKTSQGMWMSLETFEKGKDVPFKRLTKLFKDVERLSPSRCSLETNILQ